MTYQWITYVEHAVTAYYFLMIFYILSSWVPPLRMSKFGEFVATLVEPYLSLFRKIIPPIGGLDLSPILAIFLYHFLTGLLIDGLVTIVKFLS